MTWRTGSSPMTGEVWVERQLSAIPSTLALMLLCGSDFTEFDHREAGYLDEQMTDILTQGIIKLSSSPWEELIEARGYPVESHQVVTDDGYVLGLYRIPRGRVETEEASKTRTDMTTTGCDGASRAPVLIMHGLLASAITWVTNYADQSLGYVLADAGYDVWLGNIRGSTLSRKHVNISADSDVRFWNFSFQEMIEYDVPATIDYILRETGKPRVGYVGHSQGTLVMFGLLSAAPAYNDKVTPPDDYRLSLAMQCSTN
ncbi:gastric triacylglycerol lipase-like [Dermacentor andersoni]|uniref:gastric triacylglycerol lipase-like n=1 Tax=Dermacentor andersoni TaxID=34620 RepID=UPI003B3ADE3A